MTTIHPAQRLLLSAITVALSTSAVAYNAQALPALDPSFDLQELRLREFDIRDGGVSPEASSADSTYEGSPYSRNEAEVEQSPKRNSFLELRRQLAERRNK